MGQWNDNGGKRTAFANDFAKCLVKSKLPVIPLCCEYNRLESALGYIDDFDVILWMPETDRYDYLDDLVQRYSKPIVAFRKTHDQNLVISRDNSVYTLRDSNGIEYYLGEGMFTLADILVKRLHYLLSAMPLDLKQTPKDIKAPELPDITWLKVNAMAVKSDAVFIKEGENIYCADEQNYTLINGTKPLKNTIFPKFYNLFQNVTAILRLDCYIQNAPFSDEAVPLNTNKEYEEIYNLALNKTPGFDETYYAFNIKGSGSIIFTDNIEKTKDLDIVPIPEVDTLSKNIFAITPADGLSASVWEFLIPERFNKQKPYIHYNIISPYTYLYDKVKTPDAIKTVTHALMDTCDDVVIGAADKITPEMDEMISYAREKCKRFYAITDTARDAIIKYAAEKHDLVQDINCGDKYEIIFW